MMGKVRKMVRWKRKMKDMRNGSDKKKQKARKQKTGGQERKGV